MAKMELVGKVRAVRAKVRSTGAELGARVATRALDALEKIDRAKVNQTLGKVKAQARKVPVLGKRLKIFKDDERALTAREEAEERGDFDNVSEPKIGKRPTKLRLEPVVKHPENFKGRKVVVAGGRKTMPAAAARALRVKTAEPHGFKAKRGQKHKKH